MATSAALHARPDVRISHKTYTLEAYLEQEYTALRRHFFYEGQIEPMPYSSENHGLITANLVGELHAAAKKTPVRVYAENRMLYVPACGLAYYPDVLIVRGDPVHHDYKGKMVATLNPEVIIEVLSASTEEADRVPKWKCYRQIPTLKQYFLVSQTEPYVEVRTRIEGENRWLDEAMEGLEKSIQIAGFEVPLAEIYGRVSFAPPAPAKRKRTTTTT